MAPTTAAPGGVVLGTLPGGEPVGVPFFTAGRGTRAAVLGDPALPRLIALRALGAGARLQVVTARPEEWLSLRRSAWLPAERMAVVRPGAPPPEDGTRAAPCMIIDDTGAAAVSSPWQAVVAAPGPRAVTIAALRGLDAIVLHRSTPACRAAVIAALNLPVPVTRSLHGIPGDVVAIATAGMVKLVPLTPDASERVLLARSMRQPLPGLETPVSFETKATSLPRQGA